MKLFSKRTFQFMLLIIFLLIPLLSFTQTTVTGEITSADDGTKLIGANIVIKGTTEGTISDAQGNFSIDVPGPETVLVFSYVSYISQDVAVGNQTIINVTLMLDLAALDEVVVVGYGSKSRRRVTGAVSTVDAEVFENRPTASVGNLLQGASSGVRVVSGTGQPGNAANIRIRGAGSFSAGNDPLYVVDGVPIISESVSLAGGQVSPLNPLADINPNDIESISILKDAASASIYGSRAANGVVMITTKKGSIGKPQVDFNFYTGVQRITRTLPTISARDSRQKFIELWVYGWSNGYPWDTGLPVMRYRPEAIDTLSPSVGLDAMADHQDAVFRTAPITKADFSVRGGTNDLKYAVSGEYFDQEGIIINSGFRRLTTRINAEYKPLTWLTTGTNFSYSNTSSDRTREDVGNQTGWYYFFNSPGFTQMYDPITGLPAQRFPINVLNEQQLKGYTNRIFGNLYAEIQILNGLKFRSNIAVDVSNIKETEFYPSTVQSPAGGGAPRYSGSGALFNTRWVNENFLTYTNTFADDHNINVMAGLSLQEERLRSDYLVGTNGSSDKIPTANASSVMRSITSFETSSALVSYFGRANYSYKSKYLVSASIRTDGSSKFGTDNRWATFPSVSAGWVVSEESFLSDVGFITNLKIRGAWGKTGNQTALGDFQALGLVQPGYDYQNPGVGPTGSGIPNSALTWEASDQIDVGFDFTVLNGRLGFIFDLYSKTTEALLLNFPLPGSTGYNSVVKNIGSIKNSGIDLDFNANILTGEFMWKIGGNISFLKSKVLELVGDAPIINGINITQEGDPMGDFYGYEFRGVYSAPEDVPSGQGPNGKLSIPGGREFIEGMPIIADLNNDGIINADDRTIIGNALPDYTGGITNSFRWNGFELNTLFTYSVGNEIWNGDRSYQDNHVGLYRQPTPEAFDNRWQQTGDVTNWPRIVRESTIYGNYYSNSTQFIEDGSFFRLRNITLAYSFNDNVLEKIHLCKLRLYATGENIRAWTQYTGYDPELINMDNPIAMGRQARKHPMALSLIFGVNIGF